MTQTVTLNGNVYTDGDTDGGVGYRNIGGQGNRVNFFPLMNDVVTVAGQVQAWSTQAQAAANTIGINGASLFNRNKILNGDFQVWQRGTTFTDPTGPGNMYCADRWAAFRSAWTAGITVTQQSTQTNSKSIRVQRNSGNASTADMKLSQSFETIEVKKLAGKTVTLQFDVFKGADFSAASSILQVQVVWGTGADGNLGTGFTNTNGATVNQVITSTNTQYALTTTIPANATQLAVSFNYTPVGAAGAADYFEITDVQLEEGSIATPFERRPYGFELALCQRYFVRLVDKTGNHSIGNGVAISATGMQLQRFLGVEMRIAPALTLSGAANFICINSTGGTAGAATAITLGLTKSNVVRFDVSVASGLVAGNAASCQSQNTSATLDLNAEL